MGKKIFIIVLIVVIAIVIGSFFWIFSNIKDVPKGSSRGYTLSYLKSNINSGTYNDASINEHGSDVSAVLVLKDTVINNCTIEKTGDTSDISKSDREGLNATILVDQKNSAIVNDSNIVSNASGASGVAVTTLGAVANVKNTEITTNGEYSKGLVACYGSRIKTEDVKIITNGEKSAGVATNAEDGDISITNSEVTTNGLHSPGIVSKGEVVATDVKVVTDKSTALVVDGSGKIELISSDIICGGNEGVKIFCSDIDVKNDRTGNFIMNIGSIKTISGPIFNVSNTNATIKLRGVKIDNGNDIFMNVIRDTSGIDREKTIDSSSGANVMMETSTQEFEGGIVVDEDCSLELTLTYKSYFKGCINKDNTGKNVVLNVREGSIIELTDNCYVDTLYVSEDSKIIENGYKIITK